MIKLNAKQLWLSGAILGLVGFGGVLTIYALHSEGYCIGEGRKLSDTEIFAGAVKAAYRNMAPFTVETLQELRVGVRLAEGSWVDRSDKSRAYQTIDERVDKLIKNPQFQNDCCSYGWKNIERGPPVFWEVFMGTKRQGILVNREIVTVRPEHVYPPLYQIPTAGDAWFSDANRLEIRGPVIFRKPRQVLMVMNVCGGPGYLEEGTY